MAMPTPSDWKLCMVKRLVERFNLGDRVEISFSGEHWYQGVVVKLDHPGLWVLTADHQVWFVTNSGRIRAEAEADAVDAVQPGGDD